MPVRSGVNDIGAGTQDGQSITRQYLRQVNGSLPAALHHGRRRIIVLRFVIYDISYGFFVQRLEIEPVAGVEVGGDSFRVGVDHDALDPGLG